MVGAARAAPDLRRGSRPRAGGSGAGDAGELGSVRTGAADSRRGWWNVGGWNRDLNCCFFVFGLESSGCDGPW